MEGGNIINKDIYLIIIPLISIPIVDQTLCLLFTKKTRWFQLHAVTNLIIVYTIWDDIIHFMYKPLSYVGPSKSPLDCYFIIILIIQNLVL